jgi:hypothetical protein
MPTIKKSPTHSFKTNPKTRMRTQAAPHNVTKKDRTTVFQKKRFENVLVNTQDAFAYTYIIISLDDMQKYSLTLLNQHISKKSKACQKVSDGKGMKSISKMSVSKSKNGASKSLVSEYLLDDTKFLILVLKYNIVSEIEKDKSLLKSQKILDQILGHVIVEDHKDKKIMGIFDVCLHQFDKIGYGSVLFTVALYCIDFHYYDTDYTLWLGIRLDNSQFDKVAYLYVSNGFEDPIITNTDLTGIKYPFDFLLLTKPVKKFISDERKTEAMYNLVMDMYENYKRNKNYCTLSFEFDKSAIMKMRLFPYLGIEGYKGIHHKHLQREFSGKYKVTNSRKENVVQLATNSRKEDTTAADKKTVYKVSMETIAENEHIKYMIGEEEAVIFISDIYTFHTHPIGLYVKYNVMIAPPSGQDFLTIFPFRNNRFHVVCSVEGIYVISLTKEALSNLSALEDVTKETISSVFEYPFENREFDWTSANEFNNEMVKKQVHKYFAWFENENNIPGLGRLFNLQFFYWNVLKKNTVIDIFYTTTNKSCYPEFFNDI